MAVIIKQCLAQRAMVEGQQEPIGLSDNRITGVQIVV
jgi:hypothetical protein